MNLATMTRALVYYRPILPGATGKYIHCLCKLYEFVICVLICPQQCVSVNIYMHRLGMLIMISSSCKHGKVLILSDQVKRDYTNNYELVTIYCVKMCTFISHNLMFRTYTIIPHPLWCKFILKI